jgi:hypothetical protein
VGGFLDEYFEAYLMFGSIVRGFGSIFHRFGAIVHRFSAIILDLAQFYVVLAQLLSMFWDLARNYSEMYMENPWMC